MEKIKTSPCIDHTSSQFFFFLMDTVTPPGTPGAVWSPGTRVRKDV
ncbi:MAG: hypothetical protein WC455_10715 [Dehalococcoidia bacterium]